MKKMQTQTGPLWLWFNNAGNRTTPLNNHFWRHLNMEKLYEVSPWAQVHDDLWFMVM